MSRHTAGILAWMYLHPPLSLLPLLPLLPSTNPLPQAPWTHYKMLIIVILIIPAHLTIQILIIITNRIIMPLPTIYQFLLPLPLTKSRIHEKHARFPRPLTLFSQLRQSRDVPDCWKIYRIMPYARRNDCTLVTNEKRKQRKTKTKIVENRPVLCCYFCWLRELSQWK